ncbi:YcaO-like family protein [Microvirga calopogonii]|uniref:YcaO-like family protein n=1 Tax=Microvirga calopogonii TaxID=2078013 RepID=UPI000E0E0882|nr:YcaO-like family protein [Microvirga calopogonii]
MGSNDWRTSALLEEVQELRQKIRNSNASESITRANDDLASFLIAIEPRLKEFGITRIADLTGLDIVGIPVYAAIRPNSRSLSVCQGKGLLHEVAKVSAIMEALEQAMAERAEDLIAVQATKPQMRQYGWECFDPEDSSDASNVSPMGEAERSWVPSISFTSGRTVLLPYEVVGLDFREPNPWDASTYRMNTIGLGAGRSLVQAVTHAALEVLERDATAFTDMLGIHPRFARVLSYHRGQSAELDAAVQKVQRAGLDYVFIQHNADFDLPVIGTFVRDSGNVHNSRVYAGFACRPCAHDAALAALLEAVQSRAAQIAGSREDLSDQDFGGGGAWPQTDRMPAATLHALDLHHGSCRTSALNKLRSAINAILSVGADDIFIAPLGGPGEVRTVRVVAPGLGAASRDGPTYLSARTLGKLMNFS